MAQGSRLRTAYETSQSPKGQWPSSRPAVIMSNQRERTGASFLQGQTLTSNFQSKLSQYNAQNSKITTFDVARRNNIGFRFSSTQRERVRLAQAAGSRLDSSPTALHEGTTLEKIMNLRPRQTEKELGPPSFRYRPNNYLEKVADAMRYRNPVSWASTQEVFAPNLLNKKGELAKNLKPLPAGADAKKRDEAGKEQKDTEGTADGDGTSALKKTAPGGAPSDSGSLADAEGTSQGPKKKLKHPGAWRHAGPTSPDRTGRAKDLLPTLHAKTYFKAAVEYSLGPELTHRSLHDQGGKVEKTIFEEYQKTITEAPHRKVGSAMNG